MTQRTQISAVCPGGGWSCYMGDSLNRAVQIPFLAHTAQAGLLRLGDNICAIWGLADKKISGFEHSGLPANVGNRQGLFARAFSICYRGFILSPPKISRNKNINSDELIIPTQKTIFFLMPGSTTLGGILTPITAFITQHCPKVPLFPSQP